MDYMFLGDVGTAIELDVGTDVSGASVRRIYYRKPSGVVGYWEAEQGSAPTRIRYITQEGDIDEAGCWKFQAYIELSNWKGYGCIVEVMVWKPLPEQ